MIHIDRVLGIFYSEGKFSLYNDTYYVLAPIHFIRDIEKKYGITLKSAIVSVEYCNETVGKKTLYLCGKCGAKIWSDEMLVHLEGEGVISVVTRDDGFSGPALIYRPRVPQLEKAK